jgi:hypothetical protein
VTGQQWYQKFYDSYYKNSAIQRPAANRNEKTWTKAMARLFLRMAKSSGYTVINESRVAAGGRADQRWLKGKRSAVVIEHENRLDDLSGEIEKLCNDVGKLKVLITYAPDKVFDKKVLQIRDKVSEAINGHLGTYTGEFLLIVGG